MKVLRAVILPGTFMLALSTGATAAVEPAMTFEPEAVTASGMTPGGKVVWFGVAREISERTATLVRRQSIAEDEDKDGAVTLELGRPVPFQSIWVAVDLTTGASAVAVPEGYPLRRVELPGSSTGHGASPRAPTTPPAT